MNTKITAVVLVTATATVTLAGCGLKESLTEKANGHVKAVGYPTGAEGKRDKDARLPEWVPDKAASVTEVIRTTGSERLLRFTGGELPDLCVPGPAAPRTATLIAPWWPQGQESRTDKVCGEWHVLVQDGAVYAFKPETLVSPRS
ncbi:hypothetical protein [Amycolatopsis regifaucium]|uniref:Lipoprotein n=1 Tax=Amycolatopsis regifaucium TaxID=546365 RepID=A0A154MAH4_9PSEU|nr:hypothetical protein [Amycolatopsis regifaucium]KZB81562.1 hypothetical protein AVL48_06040 [Amycolatopsis regifaucium]OKA06868.1 hypothetical protein ATP06_0220260 [Amycolatopsis regifaucium]SFH28413.1 hypothetical protein SAMN04489731_103338 [Amycolatopsis regifaucium]